MKLTLAVLTLAFTASTLPSYADSDHAAAPKGTVSYVLQSNHQTVAILPVGFTTEITSTTATYNRSTNTSVFSGDVKIVISVPGQTPVTIAGDELTLIAQK